jgi:hypothetical protein
MSENDPQIIEWKPHKKQEDFLAIPYSVFEAFFGGSAGPGKSEALLMLSIATGLFQKRGFKALLMRRTFPELEKSLILRSQELFPATGAIYNSQLRRWRWPDYGSILDFGYAEHEQDVRKYDTTEYNYIGFDELTSFTEFQYSYLAFSRTRTSKEGLPSFVRSASNPGNIGHGWVRSRFVEPCIYGYKLLRDSKSGMYRIYIPALATDNPYLLKADPDYIRRLEMLPESDRRAKLYGDWWTFEGQVFDDWRIAPFPGEPDNARHVVEPFDIPDYWPRVLAIDWGGGRAMTYALWCAISPTGRIYCYREYVARKSKIAIWAADIARLSEHDNLVDVVIDPSAEQDRGEDKTIKKQVEEAFGKPIRRANNDRLGGKMLVTDFLRWKSRPARFTPKENFDYETAQKIFRGYGLDAYKKYLHQFEPEAPETNIPRLQIFDGYCPELVKVIPLCIFKKDDKDGKPVEDVAEFNGDDPYDVLRYLLKAVDHYVSDSAGEFQRRKASGDIWEKFQRDKDTNALYRRMEKLESQTDNVVSFKTYHRSKIA